MVTITSDFSQTCLMVWEKYCRLLKQNDIPTASQWKTVDENHPSHPPFSNGPTVICVQQIHSFLMISNRMFWVAVCTGKKLMLSCYHVKMEMYICLQDQYREFFSMVWICKTIKKLMLFPDYVHQ